MVAESVREDEVNFQTTFRVKTPLSRFDGEPLKRFIPKLNRGIISINLGENYEPKPGDPKFRFKKRSSLELRTKLPNSGLLITSFEELLKKENARYFRQFSEEDLIYLFTEKLSPRQQGTKWAFWVFQDRCDKNQETPSIFHFETIFGDYPFAPDQVESIFEANYLEGLRAWNIS